VNKYSEGTFKMERLGIEFTGELSPVLRICVGAGIVLACTAPLIGSIAVLVLALRWGG